MSYRLFQIILVAFLLLKVTIADTITTTDGSQLNGTITLIDQGMIHIETAFAGKLKLKQETVASFETTNPRVLRLKDGVTVTGTVTAKDTAELNILTNDATVAINTEQISASWTPDATDPEIVRNQRKWKNDLAVNLNGRTGNVERFNFGAQLDFRLKGAIDETRVGFVFEQGEENGNKTQDRVLGQVGYERFNKGGRKLGWFIRSILETDPINDVQTRSSTSNGVSYRFINREVQTLIIRSGLGYRFTEFETDRSNNESTVIFKLGLSHTYSYKDWFYLENDLSYEPSIEDFTNYNAIHDSSIRIPVGTNESFWIRIGIRNEYESQTSAAEKLDTNYYSQLIYSWQ